MASEVTSNPPESPSPRRAWPLRLLRWLLATAGFLCRAILVLWTTLALHYSNLPWPWLRTALAVAFAVLGVWSFFVSKSRSGFWIGATVVVAVMAWWAVIPPRQDRDWKPEVSVTPRAIIDGDRVKLTGVRNFDYRSTTDFTVRYEDREVLLSHLTSADFFISYWAPGPVAHTFISFTFDNAPPVCISIEARSEKGERYGALPSLFKQYELIYVIGDERDIVRVRTNYRKEQVYLYRTLARPEGVRRLFLSYLEKANQLADEPEFYHLLSNNCTINIDRHAYKDGRGSGFDLRLLLNGYSDRFAYAKGVLDGSVPFPELRARSLINEEAQAADQDPDFSRLIRSHLTPVPAKQPQP